MTLETAPLKYVRRAFKSENADSQVRIKRRLSIAFLEQNQS